MSSRQPDTGAGDDWQPGTRALYAARGFAERSGFGVRPALLVVDFINGFTDPGTPLGGDFAAELAVTHGLLTSFRAGAWPVFYTTTAYRDGFAEAGHFIAKVPALAILTAGSLLTRVDDRIRPAAGEPVVLKHYASAFFGTPLHDHLRAACVDTVVIVGCTTSGCVRASAVDSLQHGYRTVVVRDAVGDRAEGPHAANLFDIDAKYGDVLDAVEVQRCLAALEPDPAAAEPRRHAVDAASVDVDLIATLWSLETQLVMPGCRRDGAVLMELLAADFAEIGRSGRIYDRAQVISAMAGAPAEDIVIEAPHLRRLAPDVALLRYHSRHAGAAGAVVCARSSIWTRTDGAWRLSFHQGTPIPADEAVPVMHSASE